MGAAKAGTPAGSNALDHRRHLPDGSEHAALDSVRRGLNLIHQVGNEPVYAGDLQPAFVQQLGGYFIGVGRAVTKYLADFGQVRADGPQGFSGIVDDLQNRSGVAGDFATPLLLRTWHGQLGHGPVEGDAHFGIEGA